MKLVGLGVVVLLCSIACVAACTFQSTNTAATGLYYVADYDYHGTDISATPGIADIRACYDHCTTEATGNSAIKYWAYETDPSSSKICWCKSTVTSSPNYFANRAAGPLDSYSFYAPASASRRSACSPSYPPVVSATTAQTCQSNGVTWSTTQTLGCQVNPCSFSKVQSEASGTWYLTGANWDGIDALTVSGIYSVEACRDRCAQVPGALMWQLDTRTSGNSGACWCKSSIDQAPTQNGNRAAGLLVSNQTLVNVPYGAIRTTTCSVGYARNTQTCDPRTTDVWVGTAPSCASVSDACVLGYETDADGVQYIDGYDWYGNDLAVTTYIYSAKACLKYCNDTRTAGVPVIAWAWENEKSASDQGRCWCKAQLNSRPTVFNSRAVGPLPGFQIANVPDNAVRITACNPTGGVFSSYQRYRRTCYGSNSWSTGYYESCQPYTRTQPDAGFGSADPSAGGGSSSKLSGGAIAGIVIACIFGAAFFCICFLRITGNCSGGDCGLCRCLNCDFPCCRRPADKSPPPMMGGAYGQGIQPHQPGMMQGAYGAPVMQPQPAPGMMYDGGGGGAPMQQQPMHPQQQPMYGTAPMMAPPPQQQQPLYGGGAPMMAQLVYSNQQQQQQQPMMYGGGGGGGSPMMGQPMMGGQPMMAQPMMGQPMMGQPMMGQPMMAQPVQQPQMMGMGMGMPGQTAPYYGGGNTTAQPMYAPQQQMPPAPMAIAPPGGIEMQSMQQQQQQPPPAYGSDMNTTASQAEGFVKPQQ